VGYDDGDFLLPPLYVSQHVVHAAKPRDGYLLDVPAVGLDEQRKDLRNTIGERCEMATQLVNAHDRQAVKNLASCKPEEQHPELFGTEKAADNE